MSFLTGTTKFTNTSPIPSEGNIRITKADAVQLLHDHAFFLRCEPHYVSHRALPAASALNTQDGSSSGSGGDLNNTNAADVDDPSVAKKAYQLPPGLEPVGRPAVKLYEVVDHVPNPVWSSSVVSREEFVDFADGLWVRIRSPLAVVMETKWTIRERKRGGKAGGGEGGEEEEEEKDGEGSGLELVEDVNICCSKLLMGIVKAQVDDNWREIHARFAKRLLEDARKKAGGAGAGTGADTDICGRVKGDEVNAGGRK